MTINVARQNACIMAAGTQLALGNNKGVPGIGDSQSSKRFPSDSMSFDTILGDSSGRTRKSIVDISQIA